MAQTVLSMATNQALAEQGRGIKRLYILFDFMIVTLTLLLVIALAKIPMRYRRLAQRGITSSSGLSRRITLVAVLHFVWPLVVLYLALNVIDWRVLVTLYQPDLGYWLYAVAIIVFLKGLLETGLIWRVFTQTYQLQNRFKNS